MENVKTYVSTFNDFIEYSSVTISQIEKDWQIPAKTLNQWLAGECPVWIVPMLIRLYDVESMKFVPLGSAIII